VDWNNFGFLRFLDFWNTRESSQTHFISELSQIITDHHRSSQILNFIYISDISSPHILPMIWSGDISGLSFATPRDRPPRCREGHPGPVTLGSSFNAKHLQP
jgi:hypothetical protein